VYLIYNILLISFVIYILPFLLFLFATRAKFRAGFWQKIGFYRVNLPKNKTIWVHAVSVGEVNAVENFIKQLRKDFNDCNIVLSTVTKTGQEVANKKLANFTDQIIYFPYDFVFSVRLALRAIKPDMVIIAETEIWPNFSNEVNKKGIPLLLINGRISPGSHKGYKKLRFFFKSVLDKYSSILMQTEGDKSRIIDIGAPVEKTQIMGNLKFDIYPSLNANEIDELRKQLKIENSKVLIAGSTHTGEDEIVLNTYKELKNEHPDLKLLLAPRHPERNESVFNLISKTGYNCGKRSLNSNFVESDIILLDTMGELGKLYSIADIAFIGGSFSNTGGHNPLEAAIYNVPTISGPTVFNFKDIYRYLTEANATIIANTQDELTSAVRKLLNSKDVYETYSNACSKIFEENGGAINFAVNELRKYL